MRKLLTFSAFMALAVGVAACTGGDDDDDDAATTASATATPSPSPSPSAVARGYSVSLDAGTSGPHANMTGFLRFKRVVGGQVDSCRAVILPSGATTISSAGSLTQGVNYQVDLILDLNGPDTTVLKSEDHDYGRTITVGASNLGLTFVHPGNSNGWPAEGTAGAATWTDGQGCPGG